MAAHSEIIGNEVYVWMNGSLLYKKWLDTNQSVLFDKHPNWVYRKDDSLISVTDKNVTDYLLGKHATKVSDPITLI